MSFSQTDFDTFQERTLQSDSDAEDGAGGDDMDAWGEDDRHQLQTLFAGTYTNDSSYPDVPGFSNISDEFDRLQSREPDTVETSAESGLGGFDMEVWEEDRSTRIQTIFAGAYTNHSSYPTPAGFANINDTFHRLETVVAVEPGHNAEIGTGGDHMETWAEDDETQMEVLFSGAYTNESSNPTPAGFAQDATETFDRFQTKAVNVPTTGVEVGFTFLGTRISGVVKLSEDPSNPSADTYVLEGVELSTTDGTHIFEAMADSNTGQYDLPVSTAGEYVVVADHPLVDARGVAVELEDGQTATGTDILLEVAGGAGFSASRSIG